MFSMGGLKDDGEYVALTTGVLEVTVRLHSLPTRGGEVDNRSTSPAMQRVTACTPGAR